MDWAVLYFDKTLSQPQRDAIQTIVGQLFPVKWKSLKTAEGSIDKWEFDEGRRRTRCSTAARRAR